MRVLCVDHEERSLTKAALEREIIRCLLARSLHDVSHIEVKTFGNLEITRSCSTATGIALIWAIPRRSARIRVSTCMGIPGRIGTADSSTE